MTLHTRLSRTLSIGALCLAAAGAAHAQTAFTPGDLAVYRVGTGATALSSAATAVFLDEYSPTGTLVESIAMPTTASGNQNILTASGTATSEGMFNLSANGQYLTLTGYDAAVGTTGVASSSVPRVVGVVTGSGAVDTSTGLTGTDVTGNNIRGAYTSDGTNIYIASAVGGIEYTTLGGTSATAISSGTDPVTNARDVFVSNGQLYGVSDSGSNRVFTVGTGAPTTAGQTSTVLTGLGTTIAPYEVSFATLNTADTSPDTLYVADSTDNGIDKFSLISGTWTETGSITGLTGVTGLTESLVGNTVDIYATTPTGFYGMTDTSGFDGTLAGTATLLASAGANEAFRGLAFAPEVVGTGTATTPEPAVLALMTEAGVLAAGLIAARKRRAG